MFKHDALFYGSDDEFTEPMTAFVSEGISCGDSVVVVAKEYNNTLLKQALGSSAEAVTFLDADQWYRRPATAIEGYHRVLEELTSAGAPVVRIIGEVRFGDRAADHRSWTRYESVLNRVFQDSTAWIVCPYDTKNLPDEVLIHAAQTHPQLWEKKRRRTSDRYLDPYLLLNEMPEPLASLKTEPLLALPISNELGILRTLVERLARSIGLSEAKCQDLLLAVNEMVTNVLRHARGAGRLRIWETGTSVICEVQDEGPGLTDPFAGYIPPAPESVGGMGLWITRQVADRVAVVPDPDGTRVQLVLYK